MAEDGGCSCNTNSSQREFCSDLSRQERALIRSQTGPLSAMSFICPRAGSHSWTPSPFACSSCADSTFPFLLSARQCRCGLPLDLVATIGPRVPLPGFLFRRGFPLDSAAARAYRGVRGSAPMSWSGTRIFCLQLSWNGS